MRHILLVAVTATLLPCIEARVTRVEVSSREVIASGIPFGASGPYEKVRGTVFFEINPLDARNAVVFDVDRAPRNARGLVEFSADMFILKPVDMTKGNHGLFFEVNNRGNKLSLILMNDVPPGANTNNPSSVVDVGNGFLMRQGYTLAWLGWEAGVAAGGGRLTVRFPVALQDGQPISERILVEFFDGNFGGGTPFTVPLSSSYGYNAVSTDQSVAMAELRVRPSDSPRPSSADIPMGAVIPSNEWSFARCPDGPPGTPSTTDICLPSRFQNDQVYQLLYRANNSPVMGLGYITTRDFVSFLRNEAADDVGNPNPVPGITTVIGQGISQSGNYLRDFLYQGFNEDEEGRPVFGGVHIHAAGTKKLFLNYRFAQPGNGSQHHRYRYVPSTQFPVTYALRQDPVTGVRDGILKRPGSDPKVIHTDTSSEYWQSSSSLVDTDEDGRTDLTQPANVRRYLFASTQHFPFKGGLLNFGSGNRQCQQLSNSTHNGVIARALLVALDQWVRNGTTPPDSRVPRVADASLMPSDQASTGFPSIPAVTYNGVFNASGERDFGPRVRGNSGVIDNLVPRVLSSHRVLVPKVDAVGNEVGGIRHPFVEVPVATLTGWNLRRSEYTDGDLCDLLGMTIPLTKTRAERIARSDPRPSLEDLYPGPDDYLTKIRAAATKLRGERLMLQEDAESIVQEAGPPTISPGGVVNGASFLSGAGVAAGSIISVFGPKVASIMAFAGATPLPTVLGGATLRFNNTVAVPIFFASPNQVNIQVPWELAGATQASLTVAIDGITSSVQTIMLAAYSPGIFTLSQQGNGQGAILIANSSVIAATTETVAGARPAMRGEFISIFATGLGPVTNQPISGVPASRDPLSATITQPAVTIGGAPATVSFSGLAPGFVGLYQVDVQVPVSAPTGSAVPVQLRIGAVNSNTVAMAIQ